jgi:hypothetical protein
VHGVARLGTSKVFIGSLFVEHKSICFFFNKNAPPILEKKKKNKPPPFFYRMALGALVYILPLFLVFPFGTKNKARESRRVRATQAARSSGEGFSDGYCGQAVAAPGHGPWCAHLPLNLTALGQPGCGAQGLLRLFPPWQRCEKCGTRWKEVDLHHLSNLPPRTDFAPDVRVC